jgi:hypothetical protein
MRAVTLAKQLVLRSDYATIGRHLVYVAGTLRRPQNREYRVPELG